MATSDTADLIAANPRVFSRLPVASMDEVLQCEASLGGTLPEQLKTFLCSVSNGLSFRSIRVLPVKSAKNLKKTGDSIARHNDPIHSNWFNGDVAAIQEFTVFATEESYACFAFKGDSEFVWYWTLDAEKVVELDLDFDSWLAETIQHDL